MDCFTRNREYNKRRTPLRRRITQPSRLAGMAESCCTAPAAERAPLKDELEAQLQDASIVRCIGLQKTIGPQSIGEAADSAYAARRSGAAAQIAELGVIEDIEGFSAELQSDAFVNGKVLEQSHIEIGGVRISQPVSADIAEGQPTRLHKNVGVVLKGTKSGSRRRVGNA